MSGNTFGSTYSDHMAEPAVAPEKEFNALQLRMIRAACKHTEGVVHSSVVLQLFDEIDALRAKLAEIAVEPCKECNGTGEVETGISMMVCQECHGNRHTSPTPSAEVPFLTDEDVARVFMETTGYRNPAKSVVNLVRGIELAVRNLANIK